ncbi:MAG: FAD-dependent oxidoreductase [Planctomycetaceae bacterium]
MVVVELSQFGLAAESGNRCDLVVYGATPGGIACAVRAAREGLTVQLVSPSKHVGGMLSSGLSTMDTLYNGSRAPIYDELRHAIYNHYRAEYGENSPQSAATQPGHPKTRYEAHVVERLFETMLAAETRITVARGHYPVEIARDGGLLRSVRFRAIEGVGVFTVSADAFADCSYEGDLAAVAGVPCRIGREAASEFQEKHAGIIYMRKVNWPPPQIRDAAVAYERTLNLFQYDAWYEKIENASSGEAHPSVQGYNMRTIVTNDPSNRIPVEKPANYDRNHYLKFGAGNPKGPGLGMPNRKFGLNEPKLIGEQDPYVEGDWEARRLVTKKHCDATLGLLYFRQNDPSIPESVRELWKEFGLPKDEFADNGHMPYEIYARETRRIIGRETFTENDAQLAPKGKRAPLHADSISITEWFLDSHACTPREVEGSEPEGMVMLKNQTFPGQVPFRTLLPQQYDNLLVPVCLSATHVGWGTIRLEPTWMSIGEAAAVAVAMAKAAKTSPARIDTDLLAQNLAERRFLLSFFNDVENAESKAWYPAVQYLGARGYFGSYDARPERPLTGPLASAWVELTGRLLRGEAVSLELSLAAEQKPGDEVTAIVLASMIAREIKVNPELVTQQLDALEIAREKPISRGDGCRLVTVVLSLGKPK